MNSLPRLAAFDLDGTLLDGGKRLTDRTIAAVRALDAAGCVCVIATGRMYRVCTEGVVAQLGLATPVIAYNGAMVVDSAGGATLSEHPVPADIVAEIIAEAERADRHLNLYLDDTLYCRRAGAWHDLYAARTGARAVVREDLYDWYRGRTSTKCLIIDEPAATAALLPVFAERFGDRLTMSISDPEYLEITAAGADKGWALRALCDRLAIPIAASVAFGDALNDVPLLRAAGTGYAMANARPEVREAADRIAPPHTEDGVAQVIEGWLGGRP